MKKLLLFSALFSLSTILYADEAGIKHIVFCWLNDNGDENALNEVITASRELESILYVDNIVVGRALPSDRAIVDDSFDVGLVMNFHNQEDLEKYLIHEEHVKRVKEVLAPQCQRIQIYDVVY